MANAEKMSVVDEHMMEVRVLGRANVKEARSGGLGFR